MVAKMDEIQPSNEEMIASCTASLGAGTDDSPQRTTRGQAHFTPLEEFNGKREHLDEFSFEMKADFMNVVGKAETEQ